MRNFRYKLRRSFAAFLIVAFTACIAAANSAGFVQSPADAKTLRASFTRAVEKDFEIVRDESKVRLRDSVSDYWLVHVKPKRSGYYTLNYTYKFANAAGSHPEEGENTFMIGIGGKKCYRRAIPEGGVSNYCLGDTIIIPIRTARISNHEFTLESRYQESDENFENVQKEYNSREEFSPGKLSPAALRFNKSAKNVKLLGIRREERPHRNCCPVTYEYYAVFEALAPGRFNLAVSSFKNGEIPDAAPDFNVFDGTPITIAAAGTPITALIPSEKTISYSDEKRFSGHAGNSFNTNLLILQPGDRFTLGYAQTTIDYGFGKNKSKTREIPDIQPLVYARPFALDKNWSFNEWLADYVLGK